MEEKSVNSDYLNQLLNNMGDHIFFKDRGSSFIMVNEASAKLLGLENPASAVGLTDFDFFTEEQAVWADGRTEWFSTSKIPLRDADGKIVGCIGIARHISEQKNKEKLIQDYAARLTETNALLQKNNDQMAEDLRLAGRLQWTFLPHAYPEFKDDCGDSLVEFCNYYEASAQIGGDLCSLYDLGDDLAGIHVYDVMGHGVRAALVTAIIRAVERELTYQELDPALFFTRMNRRLVPMLQAHGKLIFSTACYLVVDVCSRKLWGVSAGHMLPILVRPKSEEVRMLEVDDSTIGPALGLIEDFEYEAFSTDLETSDVVVMLTDGLLEETNRKGVEFGLNGLLKALQENVELEQEALILAVLSSVREFSGLNAFRDDVCLISFCLK